MKSKFKVTTRDVDGKETRYYKTFKGAAKYYDEMSGYKLPEGVDESAYAVSDFGCVVEFSVMGN
jgi:hypothetical protein